MDLLKVGTSLSSIEDRPNRYRKSAHVYLPDFGNVKKKNERPANGDPTSVPATCDPPAENLELLNKKLTVQKTIEPRETPPMNAIAEPPQSIRDNEAESPRLQQAFPKGRWTVFRNPFKRSGEAVETEEPVQSELKLDGIQPIRNDLNDSDAELFELSRSSLPKDEGVSGSAIWGKITKAFFGAEK